MKTQIKFFTTLTFITISFNSFADNMVAKVILLKGQVKAKYTNGNLVDVKMEQDLPEGAVLQTAEKSFVKLIFVDKSQMNLGPSSQMVINNFPKNEAGIITLVKGQIRSQVTKDYMDIEDKSKSKLFIKTQTAAMGIRGTDFQVNYNPENQNTALITFEGKVVMSHIEKSLREERFDQTKLEKVVSSEKAVMVTSGQISAVNLNVAERAMVPTILAPSQVEALKSNETGLKENNGNNSEKESKQFRNPIPPGTEGSLFSNSSNEVEKSVSKVAGESTIKALAVAASKELPKGESSGFFNDKTGEYKLPAGSIIDLKTVNLIPPPSNAVFDPNTKTFIVPENFGKVDKATGEYKAPEGLKLTSDGKFQVIETDKSKANTQQQQNQQGAGQQGQGQTQEQGQGAAQPAGTAPLGASATGQPTGLNETTDLRAPASLPAAITPVAIPQNIYDIRPDMQQFAQKFAPVIVEKAPVINDALKSVAQTKINTTETVNQNTSNTQATKTSTTTRINVNAQ